MRYYKQRFGVQRALVPAHNQKAVGRVLKQYKALGWAGDFGKLGLQSQNCQERPSKYFSDGPGKDLSSIWFCCVALLFLIFVW